MDALGQPLMLAPNPHALGFWFAALFTVVTAFALNLSSRDYKDLRAVNQFACMAALWNAARAMQLSAVDPATAVMLTNARLLIEPLLVATCFEFGHVMIWGRLTRLRWLYASQTVALVTCLLVITTPWICQGVTQKPWGFEADYGPLAPLYVVSMLPFVWITWVDLLTRRRASVPGSAEHSRLGWMIPIFALICVAAIDLALPYTSELLLFARPKGHICTVLVISGVMWLAWRYRILALNDSVVAQPLLEYSDQGVVLADEDGVIRVANPKAGAMLGVASERSLLGRVIGDLLGLRQSLDQLAQAQALAQERSPELVVPLLASASDKALLLDVVAREAREARKVGRSESYLCLMRPALTQASQQRTPTKSASFFDALTGLPGRAMFLSQMHVRLDRGGADHGKPLLLVSVLAVQRMRVVNEDLGFAVGDRVLAEVGRRLREAIGEQGLLSRIGGNEFALAARVADEADAERFLAAVGDAMRKPVDAGDHQLHLRVATGVAMSGDEPSATLLALAAADASTESAISGDTAARSGAAGKGRTRMEDRLRRALAAGELQPYYQPIVDTQSRRIAGFEALVRWVQPGSAKPVLPGQFIPLAEEIGLIGEMDALMAEQGARDLQFLQQTTGQPELFISVNLDNSKLLERNLVEWVGGLVQQHALAPGTLKLEILESAALHDSLHEKLEALVRAGVGLSIDDFGTGESSLGRLLDVPAQILKIDRMFVNAMSDEAGGNLLSGIIALAHSLKLKTLAEGVETAEQIDPLRAMGCTLVQGFLFAPALPANDALAVLQDPSWVEQRIGRTPQA